MKQEVETKSRYRGRTEKKQREERTSPDGGAYGEMCRPQSWHADVSSEEEKKTGIVCNCVWTSLNHPQRVTTSFPPLFNKI